MNAINREPEPLSDQLSPIPVFADELVSQCEENGDYCPILFEWYKHIGILSVQVACINPDSPGIRQIEPIQYAILTGLLNRVSRLMRSNIALSSEGAAGETTQLIDRSIAESAIKIEWLCHKDSDDSFQRYVADGIKNDLKLRQHIDENIASRNGVRYPIENRMLESIQRTIDLSGLSEQDASGTKKLPNFNDMCRDLQFEDLIYTVLQRMGSHAVHGTWTDLLTNYLKFENERFYMRDYGIPTRAIQYIGVSLIVISSIRAMINYVAALPDDASEILELLANAEQKIVAIYHATSASDYRPT